jgi:hypothetical protein
MNRKLLFVALGSALALGAVTIPAGAAPAGDLYGVRTGAGAPLLHAIRDDYDRGGHSWSQRSRWDDDDDYRGRGRWWWHHRHHRHHGDRDHDRRWSEDRDHGDRDWRR